MPVCAISGFTQLSHSFRRKWAGRDSWNLPYESVSSFSSLAFLCMTRFLTWMQRRKNLVLLFGLHFSTQDGCKKIKMTATKLHDFGGGWRKAGRLTKTGTKLAYHLQSAVYLWRFRRRPGPLPLYCFLFWNPFYVFTLSAFQQRFYVCVKESLCFSLVCLNCWWERWTAARCSPCCLQRRAEWVCHLYFTRANQKEKLLNVVVMQKAPWLN